MSSDYKWDMQVIAEELAYEQYEKDFYDLPQATQLEVYNQAIIAYTERLCDQADYARKAERERR